MTHFAPRNLGSELAAHFVRSSPPQCCLLPKNCFLGPLWIQMFTTRLRIDYYDKLAIKTGSKNLKSSACALILGSSENLLFLWARQQPACFKSGQLESYSNPLAPISQEKPPFFTIYHFGTTLAKFEWIYGGSRTSGLQTG